MTQAAIAPGVSIANVAAEVLLLNQKPAAGYPTPIETAIKGHLRDEVAVAAALVVDRDHAQGLTGDAVAALHVVADLVYHQIVVIMKENILDVTVAAGDEDPGAYPRTIQAVAIRPIQGPDLDRVEHIQGLHRERRHASGTNPATIIESKWFHQSEKSFTLDGWNQHLNGRT